MYSWVTVFSEDENLFKLEKSITIWQKGMIWALESPFVADIGVPNGPIKFMKMLF